jgi:hypothetical protein
MENLRTKLSPQCVCFLAVAAMFIMSVGGCGGNTEGRVTTSGTVTLDGTPIPDGNVVFYKDGGSAGVGTIKDGGFTVSETAGSSGIQPGSYQVAIDSWEVEPNSVNDAGEIVAEGKSRIPEKYNSASTSGLTAEITDGENTLDFPLTSK